MAVRVRRSRRGIGFEAEIPIVKPDGSFLEPAEFRDFYDKVRERMPYDICVSSEEQTGRTPDRIELKPCTPVRTVEDAVRLWSEGVRVLEEVAEEMGVALGLGADVRGGSVHVTLDLPVKKDDDDRMRRTDPLDVLVHMKAWEPDIIAAAGTPDRRYKGSYRLATYWSVEPHGVTPVEVALTRDRDNRRVWVFRVPFYVPLSAYREYLKEVLRRERSRGGEL